MITSIKVRLNQNPMLIRIEDKTTGEEIPLVKSIKLLYTDKNTYRARLMILEKGETSKIKIFKEVLQKDRSIKYILVRNKVEYKADVADIDFTGWPEAKNKKKIFVSIHSKSEAI